ncbi:hypothetical protein Poli38472_013773 [Pythium oligandrum]|uniref:FYVE-type domain-containing protein n=1 Tax=Pythium oligandrum TaxID=41045 RepID=A0A8K1CEG5_PYTOL|nr:hypothetical protein Poli38472_013773 [Pythium oligandrum]|eukprot:TMW61310.1 hypothetical protein Poli38472_013773 [Pythium oligandrum]
MAYGNIAVRDGFSKSALNPVNMQRTGERHTHGNVPSERVLEKVRDAAQDLVELSTVKSGWRTVSEKDHVTLYELNGKALPKSTRVASSFGGSNGSSSDYYLVKAVTTVNIDVDGLLTMLDTRTTEQYTRCMKQVFGKHFADGVVVDKLTCLTPQPHHQQQTFSEDDVYAVNWLSLRPASTSENMRDFTMVCYQDAFKRDTSGRIGRLGRSALRYLGSSLTDETQHTDNLIGVHVLSSFNFKDIPEQPKTKMTNRHHFRNSGFVIEETDVPGHFRLSFFLSLVPMSATQRHPRRYEKWLQLLAIGVGDLAKQLKPSGPISHSTKATWQDSDHCRLCLKSFHTFRRCHHCRFCGEAVCGKCSGFVNLARLEDMHGGKSSSSGGQMKETRGCTRCIQDLRDNLISMNDRISGQSGGSDSRDSHNSSQMGSSQFRGRDDDAASVDSHASTLARSYVNPSAKAQSGRDEDAASVSSHASTTLERSYVNPASKAHLRDEDASSLGGSDRPSTLSSVSNGPSAKPGMQRNPYATFESDNQAQTSSSQRRDPRLKLSMSTASSSYEDQQIARGSSSSHGTNGTRQLDSSFNGGRSEYDDHGYSFQSDYSVDTDIMALAGLSVVSKVEEEGDFDNVSQSRHHSNARSHQAATAVAGPSSRPPAQFNFSFMSGADSSEGQDDREIHHNNQPRHYYEGPSRVRMDSEVPMLSRMGSEASIHSRVDRDSEIPLRSRMDSEIPFRSRMGSEAPLRSRMDSEAPRMGSEDSTASSVYARYYQMDQEPLSRPPGNVFQHGVARGPAHGTTRQLHHSASSSSVLSSGESFYEMRRPPPQSNNAQNDMILLAPPAPKAPEFVVFGEARRGSIGGRPNEGSDMIPLKF